MSASSWVVAGFFGVGVGVGANTVPMIGTGTLTASPIVYMLLALITIPPPLIPDQLRPYFGHGTPTFKEFIRVTRDSALAS